MKKKQILSSIALTAFLHTACLTAVSAQALLPYQNNKLTAEQRAEDLLKRLTLEEKVQLMMDNSPAIKRLGIPQFQWWNETLHGIGRNGYATVFPITMQMAASWNTPLVEQVFTAASDEARAKHREAKQSGNIKRYQGLSFWTPNINIFRDPRWGRGQETYGEDPWLTTCMGLAVVRGLQGPQDARYRKLLACAKHFAVHSGPEWNRHSFNIEQLPARDLWETYLPAFKALVQEGDVAEVMCAYQRIDGNPCCGSHRYEQQILRDEWGFKGMIVSDCGAISDFWQKGKHEVSADQAAASALAVRSGTDVECGSNYRSLPEAIRRGDLKESDLDVNLRRLLAARFQVGDFDPDSEVEWMQIPSSVVASKEHKALALQIARQGVVLLQNEKQLLPLAKNAHDIVVMGANANDSVMMWGNYNGFPTHTTTILQGIRNKVGNVRYITGCGLTDNQVMESRFAQMRTADGQPGMTATYWNNEQQKGTPAATLRITEPLSLSNGGATVFAPGVQLEHFSARYEGYYTPTADETLTITFSCDDLGVLLVNGDTLANVRKRSDRLGKGQQDVQMKAGERYHIVFHYTQQTDMATLAFDCGQYVTKTPAEVVAEVGSASTVVFVGGISPRLEGEQMKVEVPGFKGGDRLTIELPAAQREMLAALKQAGKRVVFVNCSGSAIALEPESRNCEAIVQAWYGGECGGEAVADVLFGDVNPSGKLPITFYRNDSQLPDFEEYRMAGRTYRFFQGNPLFAFGHGLSYTTFTYDKVRYRKGQLQVTVTNSGQRDGDEVVQVYLRNPQDKEGPLKTLRAYQRVSLKAGESKQLTIDLPRERFEWWDAETNTMRVKKGTYELLVGGSSDDNQLKRLSVNL